LDVFVDTHIFVDYFLDRSDSILPLGELASVFFKKVFDCKYFVLVSEISLEELCNVLETDLKGVEENFLSELKEAKKIKIVDFNILQYKEASEISKKKQIPFSDALFAILARDNNALLVSRDKHHLETMEIVTAIKPEELK
jgi:predicted nucleic acid-binding protein